MEDMSILRIETQSCEIIFAISADMISESAVYEFVTNAPKNIEVVMTGHNPPKKIMELADYITEMKKIKHPYDKGVQARFGIEF